MFPPQDPWNKQQRLGPISTNLVSPEINDSTRLFQARESLYLNPEFCQIELGSTLFILDPCYSVGKR